MRVMLVVLTSLPGAWLIPVCPAQAEELAVLWVERTGYHRVAVEQLPAVVAGTPVAEVTLTSRGEPAGLQVEDDGDGELGPGDHLLFFGRRSDLPGTDLRPYHLRRAEAGPAPLAARTILRGLLLCEQGCFGPLPTDDLVVLEGPAIEHWFVRRLPPQAREVLLEVKVPGALLDPAAASTLEVVLQGPRYREARNRVEVQAVAGSQVLAAQELSWEGAAPRATTLSVPGAALGGGGMRLRLVNHNPRTRFSLVGTNLDEVYLARVTLQGEVSFAAVPPFLLPARISGARHVTRSQLQAGGGEYLVLTREALVPGLDLLLGWREAQGLKIRVLTMEDLLAAYRGGEFDPTAITEHLREAAAHWDPPPRYLLLVGDADLDSDRFRPFESVPTRLVEICGDGAAASDWAWALLDDDPYPDLAVGRLPVRSVEALQGLASRIVASEAQPALGSARRRVSLILGEGRFGAAADRALEQLATSVVGGYIPEWVDVQVTFASPGSPYVVPPDRFNEHVLSQILERPALVAYVGHGAPTRLDELRWGERRYPILGLEDLARLQGEGPGPVMVSIACSTGRFDDPRQQCIAEELLVSTTAGPVAVVAASRVSYPYPNAILAKEIINVFLRQGARELGPGLQQVWQLLAAAPEDPLRLLIDTGAAGLLPRPELMARERRDQMLLYNLLGDPAQRLGLPEGRAALRAPAELPAAGGAVTVGGAVVDSLGAPLETGQALVTLEIARTAHLHPLLAVEGLEGDELAQALAERHRLANDKVVVSIRVPVEAGTFSARLEVPAGLPAGEYHWRVYAAGRQGDAAWSMPVRLGAPAPPAPPGEGKEEFF